MTRHDQEYIDLEEPAGTPAFSPNPPQRRETPANMVVSDARQPDRAQAPVVMQRPVQASAPGQAMAQRPQMAMDEHGAWQMRSLSEEMAVITRLKAAMAIPASYKNNEQVAYALQVLKSKGHNPLACIGDTGFINGKYTEFNDLPLATAQKTGEVDHFDEFAYTIDDDKVYKRMCFANGNLHLEPAGAICCIQRKGQEPREFYYTVAQAKLAGQYGKAGPWKTDLAGMLKYKARSRALRSVFADALSGSGGDADE